MAQELQILENGSLDISTLNKNINNSYVELKIVCKRIKTKTNEFNSVKVVMPLDVYDIDGTYKGNYNVKVDLRFMRKAFKREGLDVASPEDLTTGSLFVLASKIQAPRDEYRPQYKKDKEGNLILDEDNNPIIEYPTAWVKDMGVLGFIPYIASQDAFTPKKKKHQEAQDAEVEDVNTFDEEASSQTE